jgi:uncharacterized protein (DUF1778 family)
MSRLSLRLPESLHQRLATQADREGVSLNQYLVYLLAERSAAAYSIVPVAPQIVAQQRAQTIELLASLGDPATPEQTRKALAERQPAAPDPDLSPALVERLNRRIEQRRSAS